MAGDKTTTKVPVPIELSTIPADVNALLEKGGEVLVSEPVQLENGGAVVFVGDSLHPHELPALNPVLPSFVKAEENFVEPDSLIEYLVKFKTTTAIVRASLASRRLVAVCDYHGDARQGTDAAVPGRCAHVATLTCAFDPDYVKWRDMFDKPIAQVELLEFIEDVIHTIGSPLAGDLIDAIANVELDRESKFKSVRNLRNGTVQFVYAEQERGAETPLVVSMPEVIQIVTPVFQGAGALQLDVKLRYHLDRGALFFKLVLPGREKLESDGFRTIGRAVAEKTSTPVFYVA